MLVFYHAKGNVVQLVELVQQLVSVQPWVDLELQGLCYILLGSLLGFARYGIAGVSGLVILLVGGVEYLSVGAVTVAVLSV